MNNTYIGHPLQLYGVREMRLVGGRADGMRILSVRNGKGLEFEISLDRCGDICRLSFMGENIGYLSPCGYVAPQYYDGVKNGFLKSFTAGFLTTCGLTAVGTPQNDVGEELPLHGTVSNIPCDSWYSYEENNELHIRITVRDAVMFAHKLILEREIICSLDKNEIRLIDRIRNVNFESTPLEVLYHCNIGYPLLSEDAQVNIPSSEVIPRNSHAADGITECCIMEKPCSGYEEKCYYHKMNGKSCVSVFNKNIGKKLSIHYDTTELPYFVEWKMMGECEYVLGLEPANCLPDGRADMREKGLLEFLGPNEEKIHQLRFEFTEE